MRRRRVGWRVPAGVANLVATVVSRGAEGMWAAKILAAEAAREWALPLLTR